MYDPYTQSFPPVANGGYTFAFTPDADKLVLFSWGEAEYYSLPTGQKLRPDSKPNFATDGRSPASATSSPVAMEISTF